MPAIAPVREQFTHEYAEALRDYVRGAGEAALTRAYELGRKAVCQNFSVIDVALIHHEALRGLLARPAERRPGVGRTEMGRNEIAEAIGAAAQFLAENLSHFEMALRLDDALRRAKASADEANRELESFSYSIAHDLRAPLRSIDGFSQVLLTQYTDRLDTTGQEYLRRVRRSVQRMAQLIDDLLSLSRVARGGIHRTNTDLSGIALSVLERLREADPEREVEIVIAPCISADCDARLMTAALENLLGNAWKFTRKKPVAHIEFGMEPHRYPCVYYVRDNGAGFDMEYAQKLFGVFQRLHSVEEFEGTGIGLATVQRIVRRHAGRIWADAALGAGATFYFTLEEDPPQ